MIKHFVALAFLVTLTVVACGDSTTAPERVVVTDTIITVDTLFLVDTLTVADTVVVTDTVTQVVTDTLTVTDTLMVTDTLFVTDTLVVTDTLMVTDTLFVTDTIYLTTTPGLITRGRVNDSSGNPKAGEFIRIRWSSATGAIPNPIESYVLTNSSGEYESIIETNACDAVYYLEVAVLDPTDWSVKTYSNTSRDTWCNIFLSDINFVVD